MTNEARPMKITNDEKIKYEGIVGNSEEYFWCTREHGNSVKGNFGEKRNLFLRKKGTTVNLHREQGNMHPPPGRPSELLLSFTGNS